MSINIEHKDISVGEIHSPFQWEVLNVAELSTIVPEGVNDVRKVAFVVDDGTGNPTAYVLTQFTPAIEWKPLVNVVGGGGSVIWGGNRRHSGKSNGLSCISTSQLLHPGTDKLVYEWVLYDI